MCYFDYFNALILKLSIIYILLNSKCDPSCFLALNLKADTAPRKEWYFVGILHFKLTYFGQKVFQESYLIEGGQLGTTLAA